MEKIVIVGAGAHAHVVVQLLQEKRDYDIIGFVDSTPGFCRGIPIIGSDDDLVRIYNNGVHNAFVAIGNNSIRKKLINMCIDIGYTLPTLISKHAVVVDDVQIGCGSMVMPGAVINTGVQIGIGGIINTNSSIDHDNVIGDFVHIAPGVTMSGSSKVGEGSFLGTGCSVIDRMEIGRDVIVGAGAVVIGHIGDNCTVVGVPAKVIKNKD